MNRKNFSSIFLIVGVVLLVIGIPTDQTAFAWIAITFVVLSFGLSGRWMRPRK